MESDLVMLLNICAWVFVSCVMVSCWGPLVWGLEKVLGVEAGELFSGFVVVAVSLCLAN